MNRALTHRWVVMMIFLLIGGTPLLYAQQHTSPDFSSIDSIIVAEGLEKYNFPGFGIGVVYDGELVYARGYGWANKESKTPFTVNADRRFKCR